VAERWIWMPFGVVSVFGRRIGVLDRVHILKGNGTYLGLFGPFGMNGVLKCIFVFDSCVKS